MNDDEMYIPGTTLQISYTMISNISTVLAPIFDVTEGLMLSQVSAIGQNLSNETIQNWVKRGLVPNTVNKRYIGDHVARILILNLLRDCMQLEKIIELLNYFNKTCEMNERELYTVLCKITLEIEYSMSYNLQECNDLINQHVEKYKNFSKQQKEALYNVLYIMILIITSKFIKRRADLFFDENIIG